MYLTGFADEAADDMEGQIRATKELGWQYIESRNIGGRNIHDLPDGEFDAVCERLREAGVRVNCFGSAIANWGKSIEQPFDSSLQEARRAIPRMLRLGTRLIRIMSFAVIKGRGPEDQMQEERFKRLRELVRMFGDNGLTCVHENCMNYGGMGWTYTLRLVEAGPGLKLVFDTGNPVASEDRTKKEPYPKQSPVEFYTRVKEHVAYMHIKDGYVDETTGKLVCTFPREGRAGIPEIVADLLQRGYDGGISIEPHMTVIAHDKSVTAEAQVRYRNYVEYGRRMMTLIADIKAGR